VIFKRVIKNKKIVSLISLIFNFLKKYCNFWKFIW